VPRQPTQVLRRVPPLTRGDTLQRQALGTVQRVLVVHSTPPIQPVGGSGFTSATCTASASRTWNASAIPSTSASSAATSMNNVNSGREDLPPEMLKTTDSPTDWETDTVTSSRPTRWTCVVAVSLGIGGTFLLRAGSPCRLAVVRGPARPFLLWSVA